MQPRILLLTALAACLALAGVTRSIGQNPPEEMKVVVHINFDDTDRQGHALKNVENLLKELPATHVDVVCHGLGIGLVTRTENRLADQVQALLKRGVQFSACQNTMRQKGLSREDLIPKVETVPSGTAAVVIRQQVENYAYFKP